MADLSMDQTGLDQAIGVVAGQLAEMARGLPDASIPVAGSAWTVWQHLAHVQIAQEYFAGWVLGEALDYPGNARALAALPERTGPDIGDGIVEASKRFLSAKARNKGRLRDHRGLWGLCMSMPQWGSYSLCHLLMHACPVAEALGLPIPLDPAHVALVLPFMWLALPKLATSEVATVVPGRLEIDLGTRTRGFAVVVSHGDLSIEHTSDPGIDCVVSSDPVTFFLVSVGLREQQEEMESGRFRVWGANPDLGVAYQSLFANP